MCRIAGIYNPRSADLASDIARMTDAMRRGGPDDAGVYLDPQLPLALGHRRLAIIDLSAGGHQPMTDPTGALQLVFNGEIYNYRELKAELQQLGRRFVSSSDTEVILNAYLEWGTGCLSRFNGMFALALFDKRSNELVLARDHAGIKPLYYCINGESIHFGSEIRAFRSLPGGFLENPSWRIPFLAFGHLPEPVTTLRGVTTLEPGHWLRISLPSLRTELRAFQTLRFTAEIDDARDAAAAVRATLERAVAHQLISDAPLGLFLSGGIDSSTLTLLAAPHLGMNLRTLSIYFDESEFSEEPYQRLIADKVNGDHRPFCVTRRDFEERLPDALHAMDQPTIDGINSYFISLFARASGLKAVLAGHGADEQFGGYPSFRLVSAYRGLTRLPAGLLGLAKHLPGDRFRKLSFAARKDPVGEFLVYRGVFTPRGIASLLDASEAEVVARLDEVPYPEWLPELPDENRVAWLETNFYLKNQLLKDADFMSMWHGLEVRVPFLDLELMQLLCRIDPRLKLNAKVPKVLLIEAMGRDLPEAIWNRPKQGFTFPFEQWMLHAEATQPQSPMETRLFDAFRKGSLSWARYWSALLVGRFQHMGLPA